ncbi:hypothetical protein KEM55_002663 [Ascosphaera atra]|nr:hypothetical protein KEM55_002663 [Ascosphaera atra]
MDLIALATADEQVNVYRLNGQRVFGGNYKAANAWGDDDDEGQKREVRGLSWKSDGNSLAVVCSDNVIRILSAATGKTVHLLRCGPSQEESSSAQETASPIPMCIGWQTNFVDRKRSLKTLEEAEGLTLESLLSPEGKVTKLERLKADLPRMLKLLDPADALPKLSTLPATNDDQDVFSTRSSVDAIFHAKKDTGETVDVLVVAFNDASVHFRIFASFEIGTIDLRNSLGTTSQVNPIRHASHPLTCTHSLLYHVPAEDRLSLVTLDLEFIPRSKTYVYVLASQTTQLQNLLRYIKQTQTQIQLEWKNAQDLPSRWLRSVNIDLKEKQDCDFIAAVFHCVCTGVCWEPLREFLVDIVADRVSPVPNPVVWSII